MLLFKKILPEKSNFEEISRLFSRVPVSPTMIKFTQKMHIGIIKIKCLWKWNFEFLVCFKNIAPEHKKNTKRIPKNHEKQQKNGKKSKI